MVATWHSEESLFSKLCAVPLLLFFWLKWAGYLAVAGLNLHTLLSYVIQSYWKLTMDCQKFRKLSFDSGWERVLFRHCDRGIQASKAPSWCWISSHQKVEWLIWQPFLHLLASFKWPWPTTPSLFQKTPLENKTCVFREVASGEIIEGGGGGGLIEKQIQFLSRAVLLYPTLPDPCLLHPWVRIIIINIQEQHYQLVQVYLLQVRANNFIYAFLSVLRWNPEAPNKHLTLLDFLWIACGIVPKVLSNAWGEGGR